MKRAVLLFLFQAVCTTASFAQSSPWKANGQAISARPELAVNWQDASSLPSKVWTYQILPNHFSPEVISNILNLCSLTKKDEVENSTNEIVFLSSDHSKNLSVSFDSGGIEYETPEVRYSPTNLAVAVPSTNELPELAKNVLNKLHINFSDITGWIGTNKVDFSEPVTLFYVGDATITNVPYRTVYFRRLVDGMPIAGRFHRFNIGEHGKISKISIAWPDLKRLGSYPTVSPKDVMDFIHKGNAIRGPAPMNVGDFDWQSVKSVTIKKAIPSYLVSDGQLYPFLRMDVTINLGSQDVEMAMDCPIFK